MHPITNRIGCVFVPVSDMQRSIDFYSRLFHQQIDRTTHEGRIYTVPMEGEVCLILDGHKPVENSSQPLFFVWSPDIQAARAFLIDMGAVNVGEIMDIGSLFTVSFQDPDGNRLMVSQPK